MPSPRSFALVILLPSLAGVFAQRPAAPQPSIPVHRIGAILAWSMDSVGSFASIRPLSDGRVLVNDVTNRRLLLLDSTLAVARVIADTTAATSRAYGSGLAGMIPFTGDSTLIEDAVSSAYIVLDPVGKFARIIPAPRLVFAPRPIDPALPRYDFAPFGYDQAGQLFSRTYLLPRPPNMPPEFIGDTSFARSTAGMVQRISMATWHSDSVATLHAPLVRDFQTRGPNGGVMISSALGPIQDGDDVTVLNDGTLALVRVRDYHIDWIDARGAATSGPPIPVPRVHLTESMKVAMMDSIRTSDSVFDAQAAALAVARGVAVPPAVKRKYVRPSDLPDDEPAFVAGFMRADANGNVWILVSRTSPGGGAVYDVINRKSERVDRIQLPNGTTLVGFGPDVLYYSFLFRPLQTGKTVQLIKARIW